MMINRTLEEQRLEYSQRRMLTMPLAGMIVWTLIALAGAFLPLYQAAWALFLGTGSIFYLAQLLSVFTGEKVIDKNRAKNSFDKLFLLTLIMALLVFSIAIPFFMIEPTSLPLSVGILAGLMWIPLSWVIQHWIGIFHGVMRTVLIVIAWYLFPEERFVVIPLIIVAVYAVSIAVLENRWKRHKEDCQEGSL